MLGWRMLHKMCNSAKNFSWDTLGLLHISTLNLFAAYVAPSILTCSTLPYVPAPSCLPVGSAFLTSDCSSGSSSQLWAVDEIDYGHINISIHIPYFGKAKIPGFCSYIPQIWDVYHELSNNWCELMSGGVGMHFTAYIYVLHTFGHCSCRQVNRQWFWVVYFDTRVSSLVPRPLPDFFPTAAR